MSSSVNWDDFEPDAYWRRNYAALRADDRRFLRQIRDFFGDFAAAARPDGAAWRGVDAGPGANLYPALSMLPLCAEIEMWEYGQQNRDWLRREVQHHSTNWEPFWRELRAHPAYASIGHSGRSMLARTARVVQGNLFQLPPARFDVGTMFFVAESITDRAGEFQAAVRAFTRSLRPGAPFAAAFMRNSAGYRVKDKTFPAVRVDVPDVEASLRDVADLSCEAVDIRGETVAAGDHGGMILAWGRIG